MPYVQLRANFVVIIYDDASLYKMGLSLFSRKKCPLVTVAILSYNRPLTLSKTIISVINQGYKNLEILIGDNASSDKSVHDILEQFKSDCRVHLIKRKENIGASKNFQELLNIANGKYFMWLCDDDWMDKTYIDECVSILEKHKEIVMAGGKGKYYDNNGKYVFSENSPDMSDKSYLMRLVKYFSTVGINSAFYSLYRADIIKKIGISDCLAGDWLVVGAVLYYGGFLNSRNACINRAINGSSLNVDSLKKLYKREDLTEFNINEKAAVEASIFFRKRVDLFGDKAEIFAKLLSAVIELKGSSKYGIS